MTLLILLVIALVLGYWLGRSKFHQSVDKAALQTKKWWNQLFHRSKANENTVKNTNSEGKQAE